MTNLSKMEYITLELVKSVLKSNQIDKLGPISNLVSGCTETARMIINKCDDLSPQRNLNEDRNT